MGVASPLVSIITPTYNRAHLLTETVMSVLQQSYDNFEMLVIDNGSTDHTKEVVESFRDPRIHYYYQENSGSPVSPRNRGFQHARGEIICFLDSDDVWITDKLSLQVTEFERHPSVGLVYADCFLIDRSGRIGGCYSDYHTPHEGQVLEALLRCNFIPAVTVAIRKRMLDEFGHQDETYLIAHDLDLYLKIANVYQVGYIPQPLAKLRIHDISLSRNRITNRLEVMQVVKAWCIGELKSDLLPMVRKRIWAYRCFLTGLEMLDAGENGDAGRLWMEEALKHNPLQALYWAGLLLSFAPQPVVGKTMNLARQFWSVEWIGRYDDREVGG